MVRKERLELSRREALEPKSSVSTNSTTSAKKWGGRWDLNPRQPESQSGALPTELRPPQGVFAIYTLYFSSVNTKIQPCYQDLPDSHGAPGRIRTCDPRLRRPLLYPAELRALGESSLQKVVGETGFEPATPCTQNKCATKLRHSPTVVPTLKRQPLCRYGVRILLTSPHLVKHFFK